MRPGTAFGSRYVLQECIGTGGTGRVFQATVRDGGPDVAVKLLREDLGRQRGFMGRLVRECEVLRDIDHENVVRVLDLVAESHQIGIVMDLVPDGDLRHALPPPLAPAFALELLAQIADGLQAVHAAGVVHRDLKPENVLLERLGDGGWRPRIADFGIAGVTATATTGLTSSVGTPAYISPEVVQGERPTSASDVYGLGVMIFEWVTGERPFIAENQWALMRAHREDAPPRIIGAPAALQSLLGAVLAKSPQDRPSALEVSQQLRSLAAQVVGDEAAYQVERPERPVPATQSVAPPQAAAAVTGVLAEAASSTPAPPTEVFPAEVFPAEVFPATPGPAQPGPFRTPYEVPAALMMDEPPRPARVRRSQLVAASVALVAVIGVVLAASYGGAFASRGAGGASGATGPLVVTPQDTAPLSPSAAVPFVPVGPVEPVEPTDWQSGGDDQDLGTPGAASPLPGQRPSTQVSPRPGGALPGGGTSPRLPAAPAPVPPSPKSPLPGAVTNLVLKSTSPTSMLVSWGPAPRATLYKLWAYPNSPGQPVTKQVGSSVLSTELTGMIPGDFYRVEVRAAALTGNGPAATASAALLPPPRTPTPTPRPTPVPSAAKPGNVPLMKVTPDSTPTTLVLTWGPAARATGYTLSWIEDGTGRTWTSSAGGYTAGESPVALTNLLPGTRYTVSLVPVNAAGAGRKVTRVGTTRS